MKTRTILFVFALLAGVGPALLAPAPAAAQEQEAALAFDVLVYGGTSAGVIAAYAAKQKGHSVLLVEPGRHLGGLTSGGLGRTDTGDQSVITGLARDFYRRIGAYYGQGEPMWRFEPKAAEDVFEFYVDTAGVEVMFSRQVTDVDKSGSAIEQVTLEYAGDGPGGSDLTVAAEEFIDASYEGDLMARAGVSFTVGRESNEKYDETYNGVQFWTEDHQVPGGSNHQFPGGAFDTGHAGAPASGPPVSPYVEPGNPDSGLLPEVTGSGVAPNGTGDDKVQAYNFRMALCQGTGHLEIPPPEGYDPKRYELLARDMERNPPENIHELFLIGEMPEGKTDWNNRGAFSTDYIGGSWEYPEAGYARREEIWAEHRRYQQGLMYFVTHDEQTPAHIREEMQTWGHCPDEFLDTGGWPHALYVREARRMIGEHVMTDSNILGEEEVPGGIAKGSYTMDSHNVQRVAVEGPDGGMMVKNEGNVQVGVPEPYPIAYGSIVPQQEEVTNLLVPVALSASHIAFGSIRMEPVFMELGQAAGMAAAMALEAGEPVQEIGVEALQEALRENPLADGSEPPSDRYRLDM